MATGDQSKNRDPRYAGLRPFQPGQSGNPSGRPRGSSITDELRKILAQDAKGKSGGKTLRELVAEVLVSKALKGDTKALSLLLDRHDGKVPQPVQLSGMEDASPIRIEAFDSALSKIYPSATLESPPPPPVQQPASLEAPRPAKPKPVPKPKPKYKPRAPKK